MREIKFRAWDKKSKKMRQVAWISFQDYPLRKGLPVVVQVWGWSIIEDKDILLRREINEVELLEFTGLKDKNGKEIFEGDILKDDVGDILEVKFGKLPLDKSGDCVCTYPAFYAKNYGHLGSAPFHECQQIGVWMEIIGNIYSNPELLK